MRVDYFADLTGQSPLLQWLGEQSPQAQARCQARLELLLEYGHQLRRPAAENLGEGVYELRARMGHVQYRMLYFFVGKDHAVVSHGFVKEGARVPPEEMERAKRNRDLYRGNAFRHTFREQP